VSATSSPTSSPRRVRIEPHGPGRVLVLITRTQQRVFALSHAEAAWLAGDLARYLAELPGPDAAALVAVLAAELAEALGIERPSAGVSGSVRPAADVPTRGHAAGADRQPRAERAAPVARFVPPAPARPGLSTRTLADTARRRAAEFPPASLERRAWGCAAAVLSTARTIPAARKALAAWDGPPEVGELAGACLGELAGAS
jgi:hypothetical protein